MNKDLTTLAENFSLSEIRPATLDPQQLALQLLQLLEEITLCLSQVKSKFVDIDTSFKQVEIEKIEHFQAVISSLQNESLEANLTEIHETLSLYLIIKDRFGEAADWNLKTELDGRLDETVIHAISQLKKIIVR